MPRADTSTPPCECRVEFVPNPGIGRSAAFDMRSHAERSRIVFCPQHAAAGQLLAACMRSREYLRDNAQGLFLVDAEAGLAGLLEAAIDAADPEKLHKPLDYKASRAAMLAAPRQLLATAERALALLKRTAWNAAPEVAELAAAIGAAKGQVPHA